MKKWILFLAVLGFTSGCDRVGNQLEEEFDLLTAQAAAHHQAFEDAKDAERRLEEHLSSLRRELWSLEAKRTYTSAAGRGDAGTTEALISLREQLDNPNAQADLEIEIETYQKAVRSKESELEAAVQTVREARDRAAETQNRLISVRNKLILHQRKSA